MDALIKLFNVIQERKNSDVSTSYTASLFAKGLPKIAQKLGEEAVETVIASMQQDKNKVVSESADLLYHLCVLWAQAGINLEDINSELTRREGLSGIEEKNNRA